MIDMGKVVASQKDEKIKACQKVLMIRLITDGIVFFIVAIVQLLVSIVEGATGKSEIMNCICKFVGACGGKDLISVRNPEVGNTIAKYHDKEIILLDVNGGQGALDLCDDVIYLIEPSVIKLNRLMMMDNMAIRRLKDKKIVLNQSLINSKDILDFEYEARVKIFYNLPPLDERDVHNVPLNAFLVRLGFERQQDAESENRKKILGLF